MAALGKVVGPRAAGPGSGVETAFGAAAEEAEPVVAPTAFGAPPGIFSQIPWTPHHLAPASCSLVLCAACLSQLARPGPSGLSHALPFPGPRA